MIKVFFIGDLFYINELFLNINTNKSLWGKTKTCEIFSKLSLSDENTNISKTNDDMQDTEAGVIEGTTTVNYPRFCYRNNGFWEKIQMNLYTFHGIFRLKQLISALCQ